jgi:hypothetical protein
LGLYSCDMWFCMNDLLSPLARYPQPHLIVFDNGGKFKLEFKKICNNYGIISKMSTGQNPQASAIIERVQKVFNEMLRSFDLFRVLPPFYCMGY